MGVFIQVIGGVIIAVFLSITLQKQQKDMALLLSIGVCSMILVVMVQYLKPVFTFMERLRQLTGLDNETTAIVLKAVGVGMIAEIAEAVCSDSGNGTMAKTVQMLSGAAILTLSLPLMETLIELIQKILEGI